MRLIARRLLAFLTVALAGGAGGAGVAADPEPALVVVVTDAESQKPLERAHVVVWNADDMWQAWTDGKGRAVFTRGPTGEVEVYAEAERRTAEESHGVEVTPGREVTLALGPGVPFEGTVVGPDDRPIGPVRLEVEAGGTFEGYGEMKPGHAPYARVYSDPQGRFRVLGIPPAAVGTVVVEAEGFEVARVAVRAVGDVVRPSPLRIRLAKGCRLHGRVTRPDGSPAADATVLVVPADDAELRQNPHLVHSSTDGGMVRALSASTDADGRYAVLGLALGKAMVALAESEGFARSAWTEPLTATEAQREIRADLALRRPAALRVTVTDEEGKPVDDARVRLGEGFMDREPSGTDGPGIARFDDLEPGEHVLRVDHDGYLDVRETLTVEEGVRLERPVRLGRGATIEGVARDEQGKPLADLRVEAESKEPEPAGGGWHEMTAARATTDAQGRFRLAGLKPGKHELTAYGTNVDLAAPLAVTAPAKDVVLALRHLATVRFTLSAPEGATLPGQAFVWVRDAEGGGSGTTHPIGAGGVMEFQGVEGKTTFDVRVEGYVRVVRGVDAKPGEALELGRIALDVGLTLKGRVVDAASKPVAGARVSHAEYTEATTDADGRFALPHVPRGPFELEVDAEGFLPFERTVADPAPPTPLTFTVSRGAHLSGVLKDAQGSPLPEHWLRVEQPAPERPSGWKEVASFETQDGGAYEVRFPSGPCRIAYWGTREGPPVVVATLDPAEGDERTLNLVLRVP